MSLALYRRYRPGTFAEVVGQEHVTEPLRQALRNDRVHHAYLFSGPRGCGKTTSARILARCVNCEQGPTPDPCGECRSCLDLAPNGPASIDVIEIDAASNRGIDDARALREKAYFAPASSRYKIYIVDEAHQITKDGFNALLKIVEEPPEHLMFVFATTEPDKVIETIRSRTHHYPFRLVPPKVLQSYLAELCAKEGVEVEAPVLPLVVRAGGGSVRDSLSVLDQLLGGAGEGGVTYEAAVRLLGYTDASLLDEVVDAFAAGDGATVFGVVDRVMESGHDPRRFAADLLERLRDLVVMSAVPDAADKVLVDGPPDHLERLASQASRFGAAGLTRAADVVNSGLTEMRGATAPRLQLELICARVLLPGASTDEQSLLTRLERVERRLTIGGPPAPEAKPAPAAHSAEPAPAPHSAEPAPAPHSADPAPAPDSRPGPEPAAEPVQAPPVAQQEPEDTPGALDAAGVRRMWPDVLEAVKGRRRFTWMMLLDNVQVVSVEGRVLTLAFGAEGPHKAFSSSGSDEVLRQAMIDVLGADLRIDAILDPSRAPGRDGGSARASDPPPGGSRQAPSPQAPGSASDPSPTGSDQAPSSPPSGTGATHAPGFAPGDEPADDGDAAPPVDLKGRELLARELGAQVIEEYDRR